MDGRLRVAAASCTWWVRDLAILTDWAMRETGRRTVGAARCVVAW